MRSKGKGTVICASVSKSRRIRERTNLGMYTRFFNHILSLPLVRNLVSPLERQRLPLRIIRMYYRVWTWHKAFQLLYRVYRFIRAHDREPATPSAQVLYTHQITHLSLKRIPRLFNLTLTVYSTLACTSPKYKFVEGGKS